MVHDERGVGNSRSYPVQVHGGGAEGDLAQGVRSHATHLSQCEVGEGRVTVLVQLLISGVLLGGIYALAAFGLALIFGVCNILNLAHGEFLVLGALVCFFLSDTLGVDPLVAILLLMPLFFILGAVFERGLMRLRPNRPGTSNYGIGPGDAGSLAIYRRHRTGAVGWGGEGAVL